MVFIAPRDVLSRLKNSSASTPIYTLVQEASRGSNTNTCLPKLTIVYGTQLPHELYGLDAFSLKNDYLRCIGEQLLNALNDKGKLGKIYKGLLHLVLAKQGGSNNLPRIRSYDCFQSPITRTLFLLKTMGYIQLKSALDNFLHEPAPLKLYGCKKPKHSPTSTTKHQ